MENMFSLNYGALPAYNRGMATTKISYTGHYTTIRKIKRKSE